MTEDERRREPRRTVDYPLMILEGSGPEPYTERTHVENINSRGVLFLLRHALPPDHHVRLSIAVTPAGDWVQRTVEIKAEGRVVRCTPTADPHPGFATAVEFTRPLSLRFEGTHG